MSYLRHLALVLPFVVAAPALAADRHVPSPVYPTIAAAAAAAQPGDRIVFERPGRGPAPDRICAVRHPGGLRLSRVLASGRSLLLLPGEGESGFDSLELGDEQSTADLVVASHVLLIRR